MFLFLLLLLLLLLFWVEHALKYIKWSY